MRIREQLDGVSADFRSVFKKRNAFRGEFFFVAGKVNHRRHLRFVAYIVRSVCRSDRVLSGVFSRFENSLSPFYQIDVVDAVFRSGRNGDKAIFLNIFSGPTVSALADNDADGRYAFPDGNIADDAISVIHRKGISRAVFSDRFCFPRPDIPRKIIGGCTGVMHSDFGSRQHLPGQFALIDLCSAFGPRHIEIGRLIVLFATVASKQSRYHSQRQ